MKNKRKIAYAKERNKLTTACCFSHQATSKTGCRFQNRNNKVITPKFFGNALFLEEK